jgi:hypothetical protein
MSKFWRNLKRNENNFTIPKFSDDFIRRWVKKTGCKMKRERPLEAVSLSIS